MRFQMRYKHFSTFLPLLRCSKNAAALQMHVHNTHVLHKGCTD
jgi:hypothetical protein